MVKGLSLSLVSKHGITFLRISDLLTQNMHLVQNTYTYTVSTGKFDLNELREMSVFDTFLWIMNYRLRLWGLFTWKQNAFGILFLVEEFCSLSPVVLVQNCSH